MSKKLELVWEGKDNPIKPEPRILIENPELSFSVDGEDVSTGNMLIHGDNLLSLKALEKEYSGQIKCIYIDPPYNTGNAFEYYDDNYEHTIWLNLMRARLVLLRKLLSDDGCIFIQIDDEEQAYLKVLCDEVFGRNNFVNMISVNMKNIAGASGGGEDKRLKKTVEYILIYARNYDLLKPFNAVYKYTPIAELVENYRKEGKSWKYTTAIIDKGTKEYVGSSVDGDGNEIKIYKRNQYVIKPITKIMKDEDISEGEAYKKYAHLFFQTAMPQSSIRPRVMEKVKELGIQGDLWSIEYIPKTGRNKGKVYEQFYKGDSFRLFAWLKDVSDEIDGKLCKKDLQGTYWDFVGETKNLTKEGDVEFLNGKKAERLIKQIIEMSTEKGDLVLDSFLGSGTTAAVAQKMGRKWIGIEMGNHAYTHCKTRLDKIISGTDKNGITKDVNYQGGGSYKFYELAPTLIVKNELGIDVINKEYNAEQLASAIALHEGYSYNPDSSIFWKQSKSGENSYLFVTTSYITPLIISQIEQMMSKEEYLLIACKAFDSACVGQCKQIIIKKIPQMILNLCEFGKDDYNLNIITPPLYEDEEE